MTHEEFCNRFVYNPETDRIGRGGFGEVYKAYDTLRNRYVALKESKVTDHKFTLQREVELSHEIAPHDNIARFENCYRFTAMRITMDYAIMAYFPEGNLNDVLKHHVLGGKDKKDIIMGLIRGISHLHKQDIIHRDIKSGNVLMSRTGNTWIPQITDFGLSRIAETDLSISNSSIGLSWSYAAPEQVLGEKKVRKNVDLWAVGVMIYQILTGELPFTAGGNTDERSAQAEISKKIVNLQFPKKLYSLPQVYQDAILKCLVKNPEERVQRAEDIFNPEFFDKMPDSQAVWSASQSEAPTKISSPGASAANRIQPPTNKPPFEQPQPVIIPAVQPSNRGCLISLMILGALIGIIGFLAMIVAFS